MLPAGHALAALEKITPANLDGVPFVTLFRGDPIYQQLAAAFSAYGARWNVIAEAEFFSTVCEFVAAGRGVGLVDPIVSLPFTANVVLRPFTPAIRYEIAILKPTHEEQSQVARAFVDLLREHLAP